MKNKVEYINDDIKEETHIENKIEDNNQHLDIIPDKNKINNVYKLLINDDYYLITQNINKILKPYHKLIMQNIGKINKILLNNNCDNIDKNSIFISIESKEKDYKNGQNSLINLLNQIETIHNNYYLNSKKILIKMNKNYNKRKKKLKKYKIIEENKYFFTFGLSSKLKDKENDSINHKINTQKYNNNSNQVIINNIQNIINTIDNKSNDIISNNINQNDFSSLLKENQILKQKLTSISTNQKSEITNYINYIENKIKNDENYNIINIENKEEMKNKKIKNNMFQNLKISQEINFCFKSKNKSDKNIFVNKIISFNLINQRGNEEINNLKKIESELSDKNKELNEEISSLNSELKKIKEEKTNIIFKNGLTEKKIFKLNSDIEKLKIAIEQKVAEIIEQTRINEENQLKIKDLENQKYNLENKIFNDISKINELTSNYQNLEKEKEEEINDYKEYLNERENVLEQLKSKNSESLETILSLEENIKIYENENKELKFEINTIKKNNSTFEFKIKQNDQTITFLNKQNENLIKQNHELSEQIKLLNKDLKEQRKIIKELNNKNKNEEGEDDPKEIINCKDKEINYLKKIANLNKEEIIKKEEEIKILKNDLIRVNSENEKLNQDVDILEGENKEAIQSFNDLNKKYKEITKELSHLKRYYEPIENNLRKKEEELNISIKNYNFLQKENRKLEKDNENYKNQLEKYKKEIDSNTNRSRRYSNNSDVIKENKQLKDEIKEMDEEIEDLNKKIEEQGEKIIYYKSSLSSEQNKCFDLEKKNQELSKKLDTLQKSQNENKYSRIDFRTKSDYSINTLNSNKNNKDDDMKDITPSKYTIVKCVEIDDMKWCLFKKKKTFYDNKNFVKKYSQRTSSSYSNKTYYFSKHEKQKSNANEINTKDNYNDYIWKPFKNPKEFDNFGTIPQTESNDDKNRIIEIEKEVKDLKDKLSKKEDDYNRVNINYAKLLKKTKNPDNNQEKLMETISKLKIENKKLNTSLLKCKSEKKIIGISFIEDDLESSFFIDNFNFDTILDEINKTEDKFMAMNNTLQRNAKPFHERKIEDIKLENNNKDEKDEIEK